MTVWTIQEYATSVGSNIWGTWVAASLAPAPTLNALTASGCAGQTGVSLALTGTGFYDPGPGFDDRLAVRLSGIGSGQLLRDV